MSRSRNTFKSRKFSGKPPQKPSYKSTMASTHERSSSSQRPIPETPARKETKIPNTIKYQGFTYKYGNFNAPDLETVVRESKKYTEKGMDVHIKEINGRLHLFYRKVPKDMPLIEDPNHPAAKGIPKASRDIPNANLPRDESDLEPTREDWENNGIPPYWLDGISRSEYIRTSNPNAPLYDKDDFIIDVDPLTGKIILKSDYGWSSLKEFPRISEINPKPLKSWIKGSLSTTGALRGTRIENTVSNNEEKEIEGEEIEEEEIEEEIEEDEEEEENLSPTPTRNFSNKRNISGIKSAAGSVGRLAKSAASAGAKSLKNYAEWVEKKNLETVEREEDKELDEVLRDLEKGRKRGRKYPPRGDRYPTPTTRGRKYSDNFNDEEEYDIEDDIQRRNEYYNKVMNRLGYGASSEELPDLSPEEIRRRDQQYQARANTLIAGDRPSHPPMTEEERIKAQQRYDANLQFLIGGSPRRQQTPLARDGDFQNASNTLMFGTLPQSRPNPYLSEPPRKQTSSNTSQVNQEINRAKQEQRYQQQQKAAEERRRAEQERLDRTMNEFMGISAPRKPTPAATQGKKKPTRQQPPQGDPIKDFLYGNLL